MPSPPVSTGCRSSQHREGAGRAGGAARGAGAPDAPHGPAPAPLAAALASGPGPAIPAGDGPAALARGRGSPGGATAPVGAGSWSRLLLARPLALGRMRMGTVPRVGGMEQTAPRRLPKPHSCSQESLLILAGRGGRTPNGQEPAASACGSPLQPRAEGPGQRPLCQPQWGRGWELAGCTAAGLSLNMGQSVVTQADVMGGLGEGGGFPAGALIPICASLSWRSLLTLTSGSGENDTCSGSAK